MATTNKAADPSPATTKNPDPPAREKAAEEPSVLEAARAAAQAVPVADLDTPTER